MKKSSKTDPAKVSWGIRYVCHSAGDLRLLSPSINHSRLHKLSSSLWTVGRGPHVFHEPIKNNIHVPTAAMDGINIIQDAHNCGFGLASLSDSARKIYNRGE
ncbi:unnamed protein product [Dovyalis caffra]|uniref:Uncharacterized protein n=1 Tax=Dovyalis caffra TaxID=77055 RepID=A0AAV1SL21_9ROSI|nr:unnamed protein product [Dovyalis caffra]